MSSQVFESVDDPISGNESSEKSEFERIAHYSRQSFSQSSPLKTRRPTPMLCSDVVILLIVVSEFHHKSFFCLQCIYYCHHSVGMTLFVLMMNTTFIGKFGTLNYKGRVWLWSALPKLLLLFLLA